MHDYYWNLTINQINGTQVYNASFGGAQTINNITFGMCDNYLNQTFINFTFKDEGNNTRIKGTVDSATFDYFLYNETVKRTLTFSNITTAWDYKFCVEPPSLTMNLNIPGLFYSSGTTYPTRSLEENFIITNITTEKLLYLAQSGTGIYVIMQVVNVADQPLEDVFVTVERQLGGVWTIIEAKYTDASGGATFWLDPDYPHRFTFEKIGYDTYITTITPSQSSYTITLGSVEEEERHYGVGINYIITPQEKILNNNTDYTFSFDISSDYYALDVYGFTLRNGSGTYLGSSSGSINTGSNITLLMNTGNHTSILMNYYWETEDTYSNGTLSWNVIQTYKGEYSLMVFFDDLNKFSNSGFNDRTRSLLVFFLIFIVTAGVIYFSDLREPLPIAGFITAQVIFYDYVGMIASPIGAIPYFISIVTVLLFIGYFVYEYQR